MKFSRRSLGKQVCSTLPPRKVCAFLYYFGEVDIDVDSRIHSRLQSLNLPIEPIAYSGHASGQNMSMPFRTTSDIFYAIWTISRLDYSHHNIQYTTTRQRFQISRLYGHSQSYPRYLSYPSI